MTKIILTGLENNTFSLTKFYIARAQRIIPALAVLCCTLLIFGWFYLNPIDYAKMGEHISQSMGFISNFTYWQEAGYFDDASHKKWLLHAWSLSAEWQFYLIYPAVLLLLKRICSTAQLKRIIFISAIAGFALSAYASSRWPESSYFLLHTRAWEMLVGAVAFTHPIKLTKIPRLVSTWIALGLILAPCALISKDVFWPGYLAFFPVLGAFLAIQSHIPSSLLTRSVVIQKLGLWSYSIYLWHWPLAVFLEYEGLRSNTLYQWAFIFLSILLGALSYTIFEKKMPTWLWIGISLTTLLGAVTVAKAVPDTYRYTFPASVIESMQRKSYDCFDKPNLAEQESPFCKLSEGQKTVLALGDSHMFTALPVIEEFSKDHGYQLAYSGYSGCPPVLLVHAIRRDQKDKNCHKLNSQTIQYAVEHKVDYVFLAARWTYYVNGDYDKGKLQYLTLENSDKKDKKISKEALFQGLSETLRTLDRSGIRVVVMLQAPMQDKDPEEIYMTSFDNKGAISLQQLQSNSVSREKSDQLQSEVNKFIDQEASKYENVALIRPEEVLCNDKNCPVGNEKALYYFDTNHLSAVGALRLRKLVAQSFADATPTK